MVSVAIIVSSIALYLSISNLILGLVRRNQEEKRHNEEVQEWIRKDPQSICIEIKNRTSGLNKYQAVFALRDNRCLELIHGYKDQIKENEPAMIESLGKKLVERIKEFEV